MGSATRCLSPSSPTVVRLKYRFCNLESGARWANPISLTLDADASSVSSLLNPLR